MKYNLEQLAKAFIDHLNYHHGGVITAIESAVKNGAATWVVDPATGNTTFTWNDEKGAVR